MEESVDTACGDTAKDFLNIVSLQSSARPGCIIELDAITDATAVGLAFPVSMHAVLLGVNSRS